MLATSGSTKKSIWLLIAVTLVLTACGGGGSSSAPAATTTPPTTSPPAATSHTVTISWTANRETAVNIAGGGYTVAISGQAPINVPYVSGSADLLLSVRL